MKREVSLLMCLNSHKLHIYLHFIDKEVVFKNGNKFINQIRAPGGHIQITIMIDTQQQ